MTQSGYTFADDEELPYQQLSPTREELAEIAVHGTNKGSTTTGTRKRKTKFDANHQLIVIPGFPRTLPSTLQKDQMDAFLVRLRIEEITKKVTGNVFEFSDLTRERSPSPEPAYDKEGKRSNTRELRHKDYLLKERVAMVAEATAINPLFRPPNDYQAPPAKKTKKIYIPLQTHPEYNFIGLIIGPRGNTQKRMEKETGTKIAIRGKGSLKEGKINKAQYHDDDSLHVLITGDTEAQLIAAENEVRKLLVPIEEGRNEHKRAQLRELAEINGTLRDQAWAITPPTWDPANVKCALCGEVSHPTSDCPLKGTGLPPKPKNIDSEYESFLADIGEAKAAGAAGVPPAEQSEAEKSYEEFMAAIGQVAPTAAATAVATGAPVARPAVPGQTPAPFGTPMNPFNNRPGAPVVPGAPVNPYGPPTPGNAFPPQAGWGRPPGPPGPVVPGMFKPAPGYPAPGAPPRHPNAPLLPGGAFKPPGQPYPMHPMYPGARPPGPWGQPHPHHPPPHNAPLMPHPHQQPWGQPYPQHQPQHPQQPQHQPQQPPQQPWAQSQQPPIPSQPAASSGGAPPAPWAQPHNNAPWNTQ